MLKFRYWKTWDIKTENQISADSDTSENNHGSGKVVISKESELNLVQSWGRIPLLTILG
jgi:hypothetical protein